MQPDEPSDPNRQLQPLNEVRSAQLDSLNALEEQRAIQHVDQFGHRPPTIWQRLGRWLSDGDRSSRRLLALLESVFLIILSLWFFPWPIRAGFDLAVSLFVLAIGVWLARSALREIRRKGWTGR